MSKPKNIAIIGGGPAGLSAAEVLAGLGHSVSVYDAMPTFARKFLLAGKSGLNITHSEPLSQFARRFGAANDWLQPALADFAPEQVRDWALGLGSETFIGSSGRVFPKAMKASPLLRAWLRRLDGMGVQLLPRHRWMGFEGDNLLIDGPEGRLALRPDATLLALGGASWPRLGSDAAWLPWLEARGVAIAPFRPANCGFDVAWSETFRQRFSGAPVKSVMAASSAGRSQGEFVISRHGVEGSLIYAHAGALRDGLDQAGAAVLRLDLQPGRTEERLAHDLSRQDHKASLSNRLRKGAGLEGVKAAMLREVEPDAGRLAAVQLARLIKDLALPVLRARPIAEAISSAGGIALSSLDQNFMLKQMPGVFASGEMLDWEAPTGGYLLTACFATGRASARGMHRFLCDQ